MGKLRDKMAADLDLRNRSVHTKEAYLLRAKHFAEWHGRSPAQMGEAEVRAFLLYLIHDKKVKPATHAMYVAAIKFLYEVTLGRPEVVAAIPYPKRPKKLPDILSGSQVEALLAAIRPIKLLAICMTAYSGGLRISEVCELKPQDIDSARMLIHVRDGKGNKDRYVPLSPRLLETLRQYWKHARPMPPYLFPGRIPGRPITTAAVEKALAKVVARCGFGKRVTPHSLRHGFATHEMELGTNLRVIQRMLGHSSVQTTARYTHVTSEYVGRIKSPLDVLGTEEGKRLG